MNVLTSKRLVTTAFALLVVLNMVLLGVIWWQNTHRSLPTMHHRPFGGRMTMLQEPLKLSASQQAEFQQLRREHFQKVRPEMESIAILKASLVEEALKTQPDTKKIDTLAAAIATHHHTIERELALHFHELAKVCTPEQRDSLKTVLTRITAHTHTRKMQREFRQ